MPAINVTNLSTDHLSTDQLVQDYLLDDELSNFLVTAYYTPEKVGKWLEKRESFKNTVSTFSSEFSAKFQKKPEKYHELMELIYKANNKEIKQRYYIKKTTPLPSDPSYEEIRSYLKNQEKVPLPSYKEMLKIFLEQNFKIQDFLKTNIAGLKPVASSWNEHFRRREKLEKLKREVAELNETLAAEKGASTSTKNLSENTQELVQRIEELIQLDKKNIQILERLEETHAANSNQGRQHEQTVSPTPAANVSVDTLETKLMEHNDKLSEFIREQIEYIKSLQSAKASIEKINQEGQHLPSTSVIPDTGITSAEIQRRKASITLKDSEEAIPILRDVIKSAQEEIQALEQIQRFQEENHRLQKAIAAAEKANQPKQDAQPSAQKQGQTPKQLEEIQKAELLKQIEVVKKMLADRAEQGKIADKRNVNQPKQDIQPISDEEKAKILEQIQLIQERIEILKRIQALNKKSVDAEKANQSKQGMQSAPTTTDKQQNTPLTKAQVEYLETLEEQHAAKKSECENLINYIRLEAVPKNVSLSDLEFLKFKEAMRQANAEGKLSPEMQKFLEQIQQTSIDIEEVRETEKLANLEKAKKFVLELKVIEFFKFVAENNITEVKKLLQSNELNINEKDSTEHGYTPLQLAAFFGHDDMVRLLLDNGADLDAKTKDNKTPLDLAFTQKNGTTVELLKRRKEAEKIKEELAKLKKLAAAQDQAKPPSITVTTNSQQQERHQQIKENEEVLIKLRNEVAAKKLEDEKQLAAQDQAKPPSITATTSSEQQKRHKQIAENESEIARLKAALAARNKTKSEAMPTVGLRSNVRLEPVEWQNTNAADLEIKSEIERLKKQLAAQEQAKVPSITATTSSEQQAKHQQAAAELAEVPSDMLRSDAGSTPAHSGTGQQMESTSSTADDAKSNVQFLDLTSDGLRSELEPAYSGTGQQKKSTLAASVNADSEHPLLKRTTEKSLPLEETSIQKQGTQATAEEQNTLSELKNALQQSIEEVKEMQAKGSLTDNQKEILPKLLNFLTNSYKQLLNLKPVNIPRTLTGVKEKLINDITDLQKMNDAKINSNFLYAFLNKLCDVLKINIFKDKTTSLLTTKLTFFKSFDVNKSEQANNSNNAKAVSSVNEQGDNVATTNNLPRP